MMSLDVAVSRECVSSCCASAMNCASLPGIGSGSSPDSTASVA